MIILDTDLVTLVQRGHQPLLKLLDAVAGEHELVTTIISYEEQMRGWFSLLASAKSLSQEISAYQRLKLHVEFFGGQTLLTFDDDAAVHFQRLRRLKLRVGTMDLKIAAIAISRNAILWSRNLHDYQGISGLLVKDPLARD